MLLLNRKEREGIVINDVINVVVVEILGNKVRLGIDAPREIPVDRQEVYRAKRQARAAEVQPPMRGRRLKRWNKG